MEAAEGHLLCMVAVTLGCDGGDCPLAKVAGMACAPPPPPALVLVLYGGVVDRPRSG